MGQAQSVERLGGREAAWDGLASVPGAAHPSAGSTRDDMFISSRQRLAAAKISEGTAFQRGGTAGSGRNGRGADGSRVEEAGSGSGGPFSVTARMGSSGRRQSLAMGSCGGERDREGEGGEAGKEGGEAGAARPGRRSWAATGTGDGRRQGRRGGVVGREELRLSQS